MYEYTNSVEVGTWAGIPPNQLSSILPGTYQRVYYPSRHKEGWNIKFRSLSFARLSKTKRGERLSKVKILIISPKVKWEIQGEDTRVKGKRRGQSALKVKTSEWREQSALRRKNRLGRLPQPRLKFLCRWCSRPKTESSKQSWAWISAHVCVDSWCRTPGGKWQCHQFPVRGSLWTGSPGILLKK